MSATGPTDAERERMVTDALGRIRGVLEGTARLPESVRRLNDDRPADGSAAALELADSVVDKTEITTALILPRMMLVAARDHLGSLSTLIREQPMPLYGWALATRAAVEASARAWWLLEPDIGALARVERSNNDQLYSVREAAKAERSLGVDTGSQARVDEVIARGNQIGLTERLDKSGKMLDFGSGRPNTATLIGDLLRGAGSERGLAAWQYLSGLVHSAPWALLQFWSTEGAVRQRGDYLVTATPSLPIRTILGGSRLAVATFLEAFERFTLLYGWEASPVKSWRRYAASVLEGPPVPTGQG
jgi:hypothetical protein